MPLVISNPFQPGTYDRLVASCGGSPAKVFCALGKEITSRHFTQLKTIPPSDSYVSSLWDNLWITALAEGLPRPLANHEVGEPRTLDDSYLFGLAEKTLAYLPRHRTHDLLSTLCVQVYTALLSPEFKACRQSYQARDSEGVCVRQTVDHCKDRISGSHCEDCPFFIALSQDQHRKLLARSFAPADQALWSSNIGLFLPEDFRALRIFWHLHIRQPSS